MTIKREILEAAASAGMLKYGQIDNLLVFLVQQELKLSRQAASGRFKTTFLYCLGAMPILAAMLWLASMIVTVLGATGLLWCAGLYGLCAIGLAYWAVRNNMGLLASFFALMAMSLAACAVFAMQSMQGIWSEDTAALFAQGITLSLDPRTLPVALAALAIGLGLMLWLRLPFLVLPSAVIAWGIGINAMPMLMVKADSTLVISWVSSLEQLRQVFTLASGVLLIVLGLMGDLRRKVHQQGFASWAYFAGLLAFSAALWQLSSHLAWGKGLFTAVQISLIFIGLLIGRRIFEIAGGIGIALMLGEWAWASFQDSPVFVPVLTMTSLALLAVAAWCWRRERLMAARLRRKLPKSIKARLLARAG